MKTIWLLTAVVVIVGLIMVGCEKSPNPSEATLFGQSAREPLAKNGDCGTIQDGSIVDANGNPLVLGFDQFGYNYQAHEFNGTYDGSDRDLDGTYWGDNGDYVDDRLRMKWSDDWLANKDCDGNGKLDRGGSTGISRGWLTNHVEGDYVDAEGNVQHYTWFVKIVWVGPGGSLWGQYEVIQEVYNDPAGGFHGVQFKPVSPGFGLNDHWTELP